MSRKGLPHPHPHHRTREEDKTVQKIKLRGKIELFVWEGAKIWDFMPCPRPNWALLVTKDVYLLKSVNIKMMTHLLN